LPENDEGVAAFGMRAVLPDRRDRHPAWAGTRITTLTDLPVPPGLNGSDPGDGRIERHSGCPEGPAEGSV